jgi:hypothetical protein
LGIGIRSLVADGLGRAAGRSRSGAGNAST